MLNGNKHFDFEVKACSYFFISYVLLKNTRNVKITEIR